MGGVTRPSRRIGTGNQKKPKKIIKSTRQFAKNGRSERGRNNQRERTKKRGGEHRDKQKSEDDDQTSPHKQPSHLSDDDRPVSSQERVGSTPGFGDLHRPLHFRRGAVVNHRPAETIMRQPPPPGQESARPLWGGGSITESLGGAHVSCEANLYRNRRETRRS